jgi:hypothetical protein
VGKLDADSLDFILQNDVIEKLLPRIGMELWQPLYLIQDEDPHRFGLWCALLNDEAAARAIEREEPDLLIGDGRPGFSCSSSNGEEMTTYHRFGRGDGVRPFVLYRWFHGAFPQYCEMDEEFRLYHNLAEDKNRGLLLDFDSSGREIEVVRIDPNRVEANLQYLRQFQAGTGLHIAIYIESVRYSQRSIGEIPEDKLNLAESDDACRWRREIFKCDFMTGFQSYSRFLGKTILVPPSKDKAGIWPFEGESEDRDVPFIVGIDDNGDPVEYTINPDALSESFQSNSGAPDYLTPVYFRREVLAKYYNEPERYRVTDGRLSCLSLWDCPIDNDLESHVVVFLGDLTKRLPYEERLHWRQFNVAPEGSVSKTNFRRSFLGQFTDARSPDLVFRREYVRLAQAWETQFGWPLFLPLASGDAHVLDTVRVPVTNSQAEMDTQVLYMATLLIDSLNERQIEARAGDLKENAKGIDKLASFFEQTEFDEREAVVEFLRDLQELRSTGSAHRKGLRYEKIIARRGLNLVRKPDAVAGLLGQAIAALVAIRIHYIT